MRDKTIRHLLVLIATLALTGCASSSQGDRGPYATLVVENDSTLTVNIYEIRAGGRGQRLGQVAALRTTRLPLRQNMISTSGEFRVLIDPVGSPQTYSSDRIVVNAGDVVRLRVSAFIH